jgi:hypothetical protein
MSKPLSGRSRDCFAGIPHIYSASPGSGIEYGVPGIPCVKKPQLIGSFFWENVKCKGQPLVHDATDK